MKWILIALLAFPLVSNADLELKYSQYSYRWWDEASYPVKGFSIGYIKYFDSTGVSLSYGKSDSVKNQVEDGYNLTSKIDDIWVLGLINRSNLSYGFSFNAGVIYTEYKEVTSSGSNSDTGFGYHASIEYRLDNDFSVKLSHDDYYRKHKVDYGVETTKSNSLSLVYDI